MAELGSEALEAVSLFALASLARTNANNARVDATCDAVLLLYVDLGQMEVLGVKSKVVFNVSLGGAVHQVTLLEPLDCLVLGAHLGAVKTADHIGVAPV